MIKYCKYGTLYSVPFVVLGFGVVQAKADALPRGLFPVRAAKGAFPAPPAGCLPSPGLASAEALTLRFFQRPPSVAGFRLCSAVGRGAGAGS